MSEELFEIGVEDTLFHVDVVLPARYSYDQKFSRYISSDLSSVIDFLTNRHPTESRVTMQSKFVDGEAYTLRRVAQIFASVDQHGCQRFVCRCDDDVVISQSGDTIELANAKLLWPRASHLSWNSL